MGWADWFNLSTQDAYPIKSNRYLSWWWNKDAQYCFTDSEINVLNQIKKTYNNLNIVPAKKIDINLNTESEPIKIFDLKQDVRLNGWWSCQSPAFDFEDSFTLPNQAAKDSTHFPLWDFSNNLAKQIANKQSIRGANQKSILINDPTMLVLEEFKHWLFTDLSHRDINDKTIMSTLNSRELLLKKLIHIVPNFGSDRFYLHDLASELTQAENQLAIKNLNLAAGDLLTDLVVNSKNLETTIGTDLHFLLINEPVDANFINGKMTNCHDSPICKIFKNSANALQNFLLTATKESATNEASLNNLLNNIKFIDNSLITADDKQNYLHGVSVLFTLTETRKIIEKFFLLQSQLGSYQFAHYYANAIHELADNYNSLINQSYEILKKLLAAEDKALYEILARYKSDTKAYSAFEKNWQALSTKFSNQLTPLKQLNEQCEAAKASMVAYKSQIDKLVQNMQTGQAKHEMQEAMIELIMQINHINQAIAQLLGKDKLSPDELIQQEMNLRESLAKLPASEESILSNQETIAAENHTQIIFDSIKEGAIMGFLRGSANSVGQLLDQKGVNHNLALLVNKMTYYSAYFGLNFYQFYATEVDNSWENIFNSSCLAAVQTGQLIFLDGLLNGFAVLSESASTYLTNKNHPVLADGIKKISSVLPFSLFALGTKANGFVPTLATVISAASTEVAVEKAGHYLLQK